MTRPLILWKITTDPRTVKATCGPGNRYLRTAVSRLKDQYQENLFIQYQISDKDWLGLWHLRGESTQILSDAQQWLLSREDFYLEQYRRGNCDLCFSHPDEIA